MIPDYALGFTSIGLPVENTLIFAPAATFARVQLRNFCLSAKDQAFSLFDGFPGQPDTGPNEIYGMIIFP